MRQQHRSNKLSKKMFRLPFEDTKFATLQKTRSQQPDNKYQWHFSVCLEPQEAWWCQVWPILIQLRRGTKATQQRSNKLVKKWPGSTSTVLVKQTGVIFHIDHRQVGKPILFFHQKALKLMFFRHTNLVWKHNLTSQHCSRQTGSAK